VATEFALINLSTTNFNLQKYDETDLKEYLPNITQTSDVVETVTSETETWLKFRDETETLS